MRAASLAWATMCRYSPWMGTKYSGRVIDSSVFSSSAWACPVAWTSATPLCTTSAPLRSSPSMTRLTLNSLPGDGVAGEDDRVVLADLQPAVLAGRHAARAPTSARPASRWR